MISLLEGSRLILERIDVGNHLAVGEDSRVVQDQGTVYKIYDQKGGLSLDQVEAYHSLMNGSSLFLENAPATTELEIPGVNLSCRWSINPTVALSTGEDEVPIAITQFVSGVRLSSFLSSREHSFNIDLLQINDPNELEKIIYFRQLFLRDLVNRPGSANTIIRGIFNTKNELETMLEERMGYNGIHIVPMNVKFRYDLLENVGHFIVTDLCSDIKLLRAR